MTRAPLLLPILTMASLAAAAPAPRSLAPLVQCRTITSESERLACYDRQVDALQAATERRDVVVVDRGEIQQARRSVFGLTLPNLAFLDRNDKGKTEEIKEITGKIVQAKDSGYGKFRFTLEDGARWIQTEPHTFVRDPAPGMEVKIRRAAAGSYLANIGGQTAVRVARER